MLSSTIVATLAKEPTGVKLGRRRSAHVRANNRFSSTFSRFWLSPQIHCHPGREAFRSRTKS
ncbi:hypothetical protein T08_6587 [Trichinella sp. T8]|uniref:Uncharacterized protein n=1 Tax=Trichinella murrelli TaxID=144512 RepID=A0A0V0U4A4_9BILA|nr:hypothetical protein T05_1542 [Trichinella murrelli]KRZ88284.1 hypothetical protein T08_6587 [Trichinella sp. T8]